MELKDKVFKLKGKIQHYAWGGYHYIPSWLGQDNAEKKPCAEYWMGAHPLAPSQLETEQGLLSLADEIKAHAADLLTPAVYQRFGELPYLLKILDVKDMLSIQVHPTKEAAEKGFAAEEAAGIPLNAPHRNYKDKNHKPEVMVALGEFWLLHGFLPEAKLKKVLETVPEFAGLGEIFEKEGYKGLYQQVMELSQEQVNNTLKPLVERELARKAAGTLQKSEPGWWVCKLCAEGQIPETLDRGIFSVYFFNIVETSAGQAVFQAAGIPHAYLEGQNVELMANSDNVLRGGLTPKHIDVPELMKHTRFEPTEPHIMEGELLPDGSLNYPCPVPDFGISRIVLAEGGSYHMESYSLEIIVLMEGSLTAEAGGKKLTATGGEALAILPGVTYALTGTPGVTAYKAFVPQL